MRIAVVFVPQNNRDKLLEISKGLLSGIESQGHRVDIIDGSRDVNTKLTIYEYIAVGTEASSFIGGKIPEKVKVFLASSGIVAGKGCFAYLLKKGFSTTKALNKLMKVMESEGMFIRYSEILSSPAEAEEIGKRLIIR